MSAGDSSAGLSAAAAPTGRSAIPLPVHHGHARLRRRGVGYSLLTTVLASLPVRTFFKCDQAVPYRNGGVCGVQGCILADDMGLGKTLMSITLIWTLLNQGVEGPDGPSAVRKVIVVCPTSLVGTCPPLPSADKTCCLSLLLTFLYAGNWENELKKWVGDHCPTFAVHSEPKKRLRQFIQVSLRREPWNDVSDSDNSVRTLFSLVLRIPQHRGKGILIVSYETQRRYSDMFLPGKGSAMLPNNGSTCDLLVCDEVSARFACRGMCLTVPAHL